MSKALALVGCCLLVFCACGSDVARSDGDDDGSGDLLDVAGDSIDNDAGDDPSDDAGDDPTDDGAEDLGVDVEPDAPETCTDDLDCPGGTACVDGACEAICSPAIPCQDPGLVCAEDLGVCVECAADADCPGLDECESNACVPFTGCQNPSDCVGGETCFEARCAQICAAGIPCEDDDEVCLDSGICGECDDSSMCPTGLVCVSGSCEEVDCGEPGAECDPPCLQVIPGRVVFGTLQPGDLDEQTLTLSNCAPSATAGVTPVTVEDVMISETYEGTYALQAPPTPFTIGVGEWVELGLDFAPTMEGEFGSSVHIASDGAVSGEHFISVVGRSSQNAGTCPRASVECGSESGPNVSEVLQEFTCDASASSDPDGTPIASYLWTVTSPTGAVVEPSSGPELSFLPTEPGEYEVSVDVIDGDGELSCAPAVATVDVTDGSASGIMIELVWDTPGDMDPTDVGPRAGSDLDLHFLHPNGSWEDRTWDCHFRARNPNWGDAASTDDDPEMVLDDTDGWGPERIVFPEPAGTTRTYRIGVHYWDDWSHGPSTATVRLFVGGELVRTFESGEMEQGYFWDVAAINWPTATITVIDQITDQIP